VPEADEPGAADEKIQAHREDREDHHRREELGVEGEVEPGKGDERRDGDGEPDGTKVHVRPARPSGRQRRIAPSGT
jgi:hypothetical protein